VDAGWLPTNNKGEHMNKHIAPFATPEALTAEAEAELETLVTHYPAPKHARHRAHYSIRDVLNRLAEGSRIYAEARA